MDPFFSRKNFLQISDVNLNYILYYLNVTKLKLGTAYKLKLI